MSNNALDFLGNVFDKEYSKKDTLKRISGVVKSIVEGSNYGKAVVTIGSRDITLLNKTGEVLYAGDHVWIHYWNLLTDGYIALRNGRAENLGGFHIDNAAVMTEEQGSIYAVSDNVINVDAENKMKSYYGDLRNVIIVNGYPAISCGNNVSTLLLNPTFTTVDDIALQNKILSLDKSLLSARIASYWTPLNNSFVQSTEYHYYVDIAEISNINGEWYYNLGMYCEEVANWSLRSSIYFKDPDILSSAGIIQTFSAIYSHDINTYYPNGYVVGFPVLCCGGADSGYYFESNSGNITRSGGLLVAQKGNNTIGFGESSEYHYAVNLTLHSEIISSRR